MCVHLTLTLLQLKVYPPTPLFSPFVSDSIGSFKALLISHLLVTYHLTYFATYFIRRTRRAISDINKNNELD
jgi:hypothetical protein